MITKKIKGATSLEDYYDKVITMKDSVTNVEYHSVIKNLMEECDSFTEFGMCQGPSIAAAMLTNPKKVRGYDVTFKWFGPAKSFFESYAKEHNIDFVAFETDTAKCKTIDETDMLHIDSKHTYKHATAELKRHAPQVRKYILLHDTTQRPEVYKAVQDYIKNVDNSWKIIKRSEVGVGYTIMKRENNEK